MKKTRLTAVFAALYLALLLPGLPALAQEAGGEKKRDDKEAGETRAGRQRSLDERIRPVTGHLFRKERRTELTPALGMSLADAFFQKYSLGVRANYHVLETLAVGIHASYSLNRAGGAVTVCRTTCEKPNVDDLKDVPGKLGVLAGAEASFAPLYGKVNLLAEKVVHFDLSFLGGLSAIQYQKPGGSSRFTFGAHFGIGQRIFLSPALTLRIELRDYLYSAQIVTLGTANTKLENQLMLDVGVSFFLGQGKEGAP